MLVSWCKHQRYNIDVCFSRARRVLANPGDMFIDKRGVEGFQAEMEVDRAHARAYILEYTQADTADEKLKAAATVYWCALSLETCGARWYFAYVNIAAELLVTCQLHVI